MEITNADTLVCMLEKDNKKRIMKFLKTLRPDGFFFSIPQGAFSRMGISDIIGLYKGQFFAFEVKSMKGAASKLQLVFLKCARAAGGIGGVVKSVADVKKLLALKIQ